MSKKTREIRNISHDFLLYCSLIRFHYTGAKCELKSFMHIRKKETCRHFYFFSKSSASLHRQSTSSNTHYFRPYKSTAAGSSFHKVIRDNGCKREIQLSFQHPIGKGKFTRQMIHLCLQSVTCDNTQFLLARSKRR